MKRQEDGGLDGRDLRERIRDRDAEVAGTRGRGEELVVVINNIPRQQKAVKRTRLKPVNLEVLINNRANWVGVAGG